MYYISIEISIEHNNMYRVQYIIANIIIIVPRIDWDKSDDHKLHIGECSGRVTSHADT